MSPQTVRTTCPYCGVGCGVLATPQSDGSVAIAGDPEHPANFGRLCSKGSALGETLSLDERQLFPSFHGLRTTWDRALDLLAAAFREAIAVHGPDSVAIYGSGQLLTEDYYVANKLMKGFIGSANIDTNSRLCMASSVAGHKRAFGSDTVPGNYEDLEQADLLVLVGSNLAWCHPVLYQRILAAKSLRPHMKIVVIDPRRTASAEAALHLPIRPDGDVALFVGLFNYLAEQGFLASDYVASHTTGLEAALAVATGWDITRTAEATGLDPEGISQFYQMFAQTEKVVTVYSQGVNQSASGTDKVNAIINCHLGTGRLGRPGMGPFSVTGQPNAMGGREVGGLANMLAAHMDFTPDAIDRVGRFWGSDRVATRPGLKAVDLFDALADGRIKAVWIMATNPVDSLPEADKVRKALENCPFVAVSDISRATDTMALAHLRLPAASWGEKDGTVTNSERRMSRQRRFLPLPGEARPDWWIICELARRLGHGAAFPYTSPAEIFNEHIALSGFENAGRRDFDLSGLAGCDYETLAPVQWPVRGDGGTPRLFADGRFFTPDGKARILPIAPPPPLRSAPGALRLNTGRVRDHWHTMTRTGKTPRLSAHLAEPFVEIHPDDAAAIGLKRAGLVRISNRLGAVVVRALITERQARGQLFVPMHWTDQFAASGRIDALVPGKTDPVSGQPALKMAEVFAEPVAPALYGFLVSRGRPEPETGYWAMARAPAGWRCELAFWSEPADWSAFLDAMLGNSGRYQTVADARSGRRGFACIEDGHLVAALFVSPDPVLVSRQWAAGLLAETGLTASTVLAGRPGADRPDGGAIVCSCNGVGINTIVDAVTRHGCASVEAVGALTRAGTNCGSCRAEIRGIVDAHRLAAAE